MASPLRRLKALLKRRGSVQESAACARALANLATKASLDEWFQTAQMTQGLLTAQWWQAQGNVPMPYGLSKQLDPEDPAFLPPLTVIQSLFAKEYTLLSDPAKSHFAEIDPWGWFGPRGRPMVTAWCFDGERWFCAGKLPFAKESVKCTQVPTDDGHGIQSTFDFGKIQLELLHWPSVQFHKRNDQLAWSMAFRLRAQEDCQAKLVLAIRPMEKDGAHPIFHLQRRKGTWFVENKPYVTLSEMGNSALLSQYGSADIWTQCQKQQFWAAEDIQIHCSVGQASGCEVYQQDLNKGEVFSVYALIDPPDDRAYRHYGNPKNAWKGAVADRKMIRSNGARIELAKHQWLLQRVEQRLLMNEGDLDLSHCLAAVALTRLGFVHEAGKRLGDYLEELSNTEALHSEMAAIVAWACTEYVLWTKEKSWVKSYLEPLERILDALAQSACIPSEEGMFRPGSERWCEIWRLAALVNGVRALRGQDVSIQRWAIAGASGREQLISLLGEAPWSISSVQSPDGASAWLLAAGWLNLIDLDNPQLIETEHFVGQFLHHGGILWKGGAHLGATGIWLANQKRRDPSLDVVSIIANFASSTGSLPKVWHRSRGALIDGDSLLSSAIFALLVLDDIQIQRHSIVKGTLIQKATELPTPFGRMDIMDGKIQQKISIPIVYTASN